MKELKRLPESELDIMLAVWTAGGEATAPEISTLMGRELTASALHSYLKRLEEKGYLNCGKEGKTNRYSALVSQGDYQQCESRNILKKLYDNSLSRFAAALYDGDGVEPGDLSELRRLLEDWKGEDGT